MYVRANTSIEEIKSRIKAVEDELSWNKRLTADERTCLHDELDYYTASCLLTDFKEV